MKYSPYILIITGILFCLACSCSNQSNTDSSENKERITTISKDTQYQGGGNEPGWHVILMEDKSGGLEYSLTLEYGERELFGIAELLPGADPNKATHYILHDETKPLILNITYDQCIDDGDQQFETSVMLTDKNFALKGCGSFE